MLIAAKCKDVVTQELDRLDHLELVRDDALKIALVVWVTIEVLLQVSFSL